MIICTNDTRIQDKKLKVLKVKVKKITKCNGVANLVTVLKKLNAVSRGFVSYFKVVDISAKRVGELSKTKIEGYTVELSENRGKTTPWVKAVEVPKSV
jgi:hypothetical protein